MKHVVLDTNIILREPSILTRRAAGVHFYIPSVVLLELQRVESFHQHLQQPAVGYLRLIEEAVKAGYASILDSGTSTPEHADVFIVEAVNTLAQTEFETFLATEDRELARRAERKGLKVLQLNDVIALLQSEPTETSSSLEGLVREVKQLNRSYLLINLLFSIAIGVLSNFTFAHFTKIVEAITRWGVFVLIPVLGVALYWIRANFRLTYGISELLVGLITAIRVVFPQLQLGNLEAIAILQILGGLYIMVRGLDNVGRGLRGTSLYPLWQKWFGDS